MDLGARSKSASSSGRHGFMGVSSKESKGGNDLSVNPPSNSVGRSFSANTSPRFANIELKESANQPHPKSADVGLGKQAPPMSASALSVAGSKSNGTGLTLSAPAAPWSSSKRVGGAPVGEAMEKPLSFKKHRQERDVLSRTPKLTDGNTDYIEDNSHLSGVRLPNVTESGVGCKEGSASKGKKKAEVGARANLERTTQEWGTAGHHDATEKLSQRLV